MKGIQRKNWDEGGGLLISLDGVPPTQIVGVSASDIPLHDEVQKKHYLLAPAHPGSPGKRAVKRLSLCVYVHDRIIRACGLPLEEDPTMLMTA